MIDVDGVFVQIGLAPNSAPFKEVVKTTPYGEIEIDTTRELTFRYICGGDVTTVPYKQIIVSMGEGAVLL